MFLLLTDDKFAAWVSEHNSDLLTDEQVQQIIFQLRNPHNGNPTILNLELADIY